MFTAPGQYISNFLLQNWMWKWCIYDTVFLVRRQVLVLDEADRILDAGFRKALDAIISNLPKQRQTLLFSATQTKSVRDLARLSLKDPEYISVHAESTTATPERLHQVAMEVPLDQKLSMLWSFIRAHLRSKILVFLSTCNQVYFYLYRFSIYHCRHIKILN